MRTRRNRCAAGKSTKRRGRLWHERRRHVIWVCGEDSLPHSNYAARAGHAFPHRALSCFKDIAHHIFLVEYYAKGIVKTSEEGRQLTPIYDASDINAPVNINAIYTRRVRSRFFIKAIKLMRMRAHIRNTEFLDFLFRF